MSIQVFCPFLIRLFVLLVLSCMSCLYILEINPLSVDLFANIFSHSEGCLFVLFVVSFALQKLLQFIRSHLFIFVFISIALGGGSKKILLWFMSESVFPVLSSKSFIVSGLTFRFLIHFEFNFVYGVLQSWSAWCPWGDERWEACSSGNHDTGSCPWIPDEAGVYQDDGDEVRWYCINIDSSICIQIFWEWSILFYN